MEARDRSELEAALAAADAAGLEEDDEDYTKATQLLKVIEGIIEAVVPEPIVPEPVQQTQQAQQHPKTGNNGERQSGGNGVGDGSSGGGGSSSSSSASATSTATAMEGHMNGSGTESSTGLSIATDITDLPIRVAEASSWSKQQVAVWLGSIGEAYQQHTAMFLANAVDDVDGEALLDAEFCAEDLRELGVSKLQCRRIMRGIAVLAAAVVERA
jgi:hypothetical protein